MKTLKITMFALLCALMSTNMHTMHIVQGNITKCIAHIHRYLYGSMHHVRKSLILDPVEHSTNDLFWSDIESLSRDPVQHADNREWLKKRNIIYGDTVIGYVRYRNFTRKDVPILYLSYLAIDPKYRNKGFGSYILEQIELDARSKGTKEIELDSVTEAASLYFKHGFIPTKQITNFLKDTEIPMAKKLTPLSRKSDLGLPTQFNV